MLLTNKDIKELNTKFKKCIENTVNRQNNTPFSFVDVDGLIVGLKEEWALTIYNNKILLNNYLYSNYGRVKNVNSGQLVKQRLDINKGYFKIRLNRDGKQYYIETHRLVAQCFSDNPYNKKYVNHINECKTFNIALNLNWMTQKENSNHGTCRIRSRIRIRNNFNNNASIQVYQYSLDGKLIKVFPSISECTRNGFSGGCVCQCCKKEYGNMKTFIYKGYAWSYSELSKDEILKEVDRYKEVAKLPRKSHRGMKVYSYDLDKKLIKIYDKILDVYKEGFDGGNVSKACNNKYCGGNVYKDRIWSFEPLEE